jgi:hypothetical protein
VSNYLSCLNSTDWIVDIPVSSKVKITKRRATTAFQRYNFAILEILDMSDEWNATNSTGDDFFAIFDAVFSVDMPEH